MKRARGLLGEALEDAAEVVTGGEPGELRDALHAERGLARQELLGPLDAKLHEVALERDPLLSAEEHAEIVGREASDSRHAPQGERLGVVLAHVLLGAAQAPILPRRNRLFGGLNDVAKGPAID